ncbi:MAG: hypothetical protein NZ899_12700 [Thermoguttaceae bacterium]|nr:hypothetical protein [Thermoguttaceae bacterium]MDW8080076.1 hypothetical protein [Thermoguttaceae bacterium]
MDIGADEEKIIKIHDAICKDRRELRRRGKDPQIRMRRYRGMFAFYPPKETKPPEPGSDPRELNYRRKSAQWCLKTIRNCTRPEQRKRMFEVVAGSKSTAERHGKLEDKRLKAPQRKCSAGQLAGISRRQSRAFLFWRN